MMVELLFLIPFVTGIVTFFLPPRLGRWMLVLTGIVHLSLAVQTLFGMLKPNFPNYFGVSSEGMLVLLVTSVLFLLISLYSLSYLKETMMDREQIFNGSMMIFLAAMSMVALAENIIVIWIAIESTTLASAPLIFVHRSKEALEATWKYILICSVGIALALLGSFFMTLSVTIGGVDIPLTFSELAKHAATLDKIWLKTGFIFIVIGYGTKMGLAPMHTWLPDAHSEAPSPASALLSGALLNCAFLGIFKTNNILHLAGLGKFSSTILITLGLVSMIVSATFVLRQADYKRLLAYSSIENMGIIAFGTGIGGIAAFGAMLHLIHHSLIKSSLFLTSGNILLAYGSKVIKMTGNMAKLLPKSFAAFFGGFIGISGFPPFGIFLSELIIIIGAFKQGAYISVGIFIFSLIFIFAGISRYIMRMSFGEVATKEVFVKDKWMRILPSYVLLATSVALTFWMPTELYETILKAITIIGEGL